MAGAGADERESLSPELRVHKELTERLAQEHHHQQVYEVFQYSLIASVQEDVW
jgi:hypothetical protein